MSITTALKIKDFLRERRWTTKVLAEKTGMSESYLTHIKNGTRRWNEDALEKIAVAFGVEPHELLYSTQERTDQIDRQIRLSSGEVVPSAVKIQAIPLVGKIPTEPNPFTNQVTQVTTGFKDQFLPVLGKTDAAMFAFKIEDDLYYPTFCRGDVLIISPEEWTSSGDTVAVEYGPVEQPIITVVKISYSGEFVVLDALNHKSPPVALIRGKDNFRVIGKVIFRYQNFA